MRLRTRLILAAGYLLAVVVIGLEIPLAITINASATRETEDALVSNAALVAARVNDDVPRLAQARFAAAAAQFIQSVAVSTAHGVGPGNRVLIVNAQGVVVADSQGPAAIGQFYATSGRPGLGLVLRSGGSRIEVGRRPSQDLGQDLLVATAPVVHAPTVGNPEVVGAVRFSEPVGGLERRIHRAWIGLGVIGAGAVLTGLALAWFLAVGLARPVGRLAEAARRLGRGDLSARAEPSGPKEVATLAETFNRMAESVSTNVVAQRDFMANASHQLRTPLTGLSLRLEAIESDGGPAGEQAHKARAEVRRLNELVDDLLELARATSVETAGEQLDLGEEAADAADRWAGPAEDAGKRLVTRADGAVPVWVNAQDLGHVLDNLLENAIRYAPAGAEISVEAMRLGEGGLLTVANTGPGIPPEDRERLFERFYRGSTGKAAGPGTGLGLAVVAQLVGRWGGYVRLADGPGTIFEISLPSSPSVPLPNVDRT